MSVSEKQQEQQSSLHTKLWAIANDLRGNMEANEFKNYILGLIFYRYLSEKVEVKAAKLLEEDDLSYEEAWKDDEYRLALQGELISDIGYFIEPSSLYSTLFASGPIFFAKFRHIEFLLLKTREYYFH